MKKSKALHLLSIMASVTLPSLLPGSDSNQVDIEQQVIVDFKTGHGASEWAVEDDVVMGGRSNGEFQINQDGFGIFSGTVSLENNGGFSSIQYNFDATDVSAHHHAYIRLKGDGKAYQFRVKSSRRERPSYIYEFETTGDWQTVEIPLEEMYPTFRGRRLDIPNYPGQTMSQLRFLIGNGKAESFELKIEKIWLQ